MKSHEKLSTPRDEGSYELRTGPIKTEPPAKSVSPDAAYGWPNENGSQINIVPPNRILETKEMDMKFEGRGKDRVERDEEYGWSGSRTAMTTTTVL